MSDDVKTVETEAKPNQSKTYSEEEFKKLIEERDKAKDKARKFEDAEKKATEEKAIKAGEFDKVKSTYEVEIAKKDAEIAELAKKAAKADELDRMTREKALAKITDPKLQGIATELSTARLMELVETIETEKGSPFSGKQKSTPDKTNPYNALPGENYKTWQERINKIK
jgi:hypothetical protein